jgi:hypothetical protein
MDVSKIDLTAVSRALDDPDPDREHFLDLSDGSMWTFVFSESSDETRKRHEEILGAQTHRKIPSMTTQEAFEEIEDFVEAMDDRGKQDLFFKVLEKKGALRNFRETLMKYPEERMGWSTHRKAGTQRRLNAFLEALGMDQASLTTGAQ